MINLKNKNALLKVTDKLYKEAEEKFEDYVRELDEIPNDTEKMFIYYRLLDEYFEGVIIEDVDILYNGYYVFYICKNGTVVSTIEHDISNDFKRNPESLYTFRKSLVAMDFSPFSLQKYLELLPNEIPAS